MAEVAELYRRAWSLMRAWPALLLLPMSFEFAQHVVEIQVGMYDGTMSDPYRAVVLGVGTFKALAIICTMYLSWRFWFARGAIRSMQPDIRMAKGFAAFLGIQTGGTLIALGLARTLLHPTSPPVGSSGILIGALPLIVWTLASVLMIPWYVALGVGDREITFLRSIMSAADRPFGIWGLFFAGYLPPIAAHYAVSYAAIWGGPAWPLMIVDTGIVGYLAAVLAATYYTIYSHVAARLDAPGEAASADRSTSPIIDHR